MNSRPKTPNRLSIVASLACADQSEYLANGGKGMHIRATGPAEKKGPRFRLRYWAKQCDTWGKNVFLMAEGISGGSWKDWRGAVWMLLDDGHRGLCRTNRPTVGYGTGVKKDGEQKGFAFCQIGTALPFGLKENS